MTLSRPNRAGFMFPVAFVALMVFAIVGMTMMFTGTSEYQQTAVVTFGLVSNQLVLGVMDEIQALVYDKVNNIDAAAAVWRTEVLEAAKSGAELKKDLKGELVDSKAAIESMKGELVEAKVTFLGFRPIKYATKTTYDINDVYYHKTGLDTQRVEAPGNPTTGRDRIGYYRIEGSVRFGRALRYYSMIHDVKIVDVSPPAREFALFAFNVFKPDQEDYLKTCLTKGGPMRIYANDVGRIFIRGPYFLEVGDKTDGTGGSDPPDDMKFSLLDSGHYWDWGLIPAFREGLETGSWNHRDPGRPKKKSDSFKLSLNFLGFEGSGDPGMSISNGDAWYVGTVGRDKPNFSIYGDPSTNKWEAFRGVKVKEDDRGQRVGKGQPFTEGIDALRNSGAEGEAFVCEPDGEGLIGQYNVARFKCWTFKLFFVKMKGYEVNVDTGKQIYTPYGLRWEKKRQGASGLISTILDVVSIATAFVGGFAASGVGNVLLEVGKAGLQGMAASAMASMLFPPGALPPAGIDADDLLRISADGYWPPNYKPYTRCATRIYPTVKDALGGEDKPLLLDGTVMVDKLDYDRTLRYRGKGILGSFVSARDITSPVLAGGFARDTSDQLGLDSWLTVCYWSPVDLVTAPESMLTLNNPDTGANEGTVMAAGGVKPMGPRTIITGNMVCLALNKMNIEDGNGLDVLYDRQNLTNSTLGGKYDPEQWMVPSVSPKLAAMSDRFIITSGGGVTGEGEGDLGGITGF